VSGPSDPGPVSPLEPFPRLPEGESDSPPTVAGAAAGRKWGRTILALVPALIPAAILIAIVVALASASGLYNFGSSFFSFNWDGRTQFGIGVFVVGSFITALPALFFSMIIGLGIAIAATTYLPRVVARVLNSFVDLLAGIPSVIYGIWTYIIIAPVLGKIIEPWMVTNLAFLPGFGPPIRTDGYGVLLAIFVLTLMALPITTLLIRDALNSVPKDLWESGLALGATRWEVVRKVAMPYGRRGIVSAAFLGFGRAFGETVAVAMVIGSVAHLPVNVYGITDTMAANMFESLDSALGASSGHLLAALAEMAIVLLIISVIVNVVGRRLIASFTSTQMSGV
jgi:phosphate transport system permease protein